MNEAWPRFLPGAGPEATAHALIIEAHTILVEQCVEPQQELIDAHRRALSYARGRCGEAEVRAAWQASAAANKNAPPERWLSLLLFGADAVESGAVGSMNGSSGSAFGIAAPATSASRLEIAPASAAATLAAAPACLVASSFSRSRRRGTEPKKSMNGPS